MEIKKGISQMEEYPNAEINYVVPEDGKMYYVLKNGILKNGSIIATLDPKKAIDDGVMCNNIGVFKEDGSVLVDFDKKEIKTIDDEYVLAVNAFPKTKQVIDALKNENDEISKAMLKNSSTTIGDKIMIEMGIAGELLFSDEYSEANIYKLDEPNHKIGPDSSFIGRNDNNFYFHTNDATEETIVISLNGKLNEESKGFAVPETPITNNVPTEINVAEEIHDIAMPTEDKQEDNEQEFELNEIPEDAEPNLKLDINQNVLEGFKNKEEEEKEEVEFENAEVEVPTETTNYEENNTEDVVLDNVIEVMKKMIEETNKLNQRIDELEKELEVKRKLLANQESKKHELSNLLDEANEVLENID